MRRHATSWFQGWKITLLSTEFQSPDGSARFASTALLEPARSRQRITRSSMVHTDEAFATYAEANTDALARAKRHIANLGESAATGGGAQQEAPGTQETAECQGARFEISFDGKRYIFRHYRYDRFQDALRYAMAQRGKPGFQPDPAFQPHWMPPYLPSPDDELAMRPYGIRFANGAFCYGLYRYERLADALAFAASQTYKS